MFEESLFDQAPVEPPKEGDFLHDYEVKSSWEASPYIYKIFGASAILNLLIIAIVGQSSLLTAKACDSPLVGRVCQVIDTVYVGSTLLGTDREYVDAVYDKTELGDADITFVDVSGIEPPLEYPEGYFQIANPEQAMMTDTAMVYDSSTAFPGFPSPSYNPVPPPSTSSPGLVNTTPVIPKSNPNPVSGELPTFGDTETKTPRKGRGGRIPKTGGNSETANANTNTNTNGNPTLDANATANANPEEAQPDKNGVYINKRPLKDQAKSTLVQIDEKKVKLDKPFRVVISGTLGLGKDGKTVVLKNPKPLPVDKNFPNDPAMVKLVQDWILAVGDAGWLGYLDKLKSKNVIITVEQNDQALVASVQADQPSENDARQAASGLNTLLAFAVPMAKGDEQTFLKKASVTSNGKTFVLNFNIEKPLVQEMIQRKLAEEKENKSEPSSTAAVKPSNNAAAK